MLEDSTEASDLEPVTDESYDAAPAPDLPSMVNVLRAVVDAQDDECREAYDNRGWCDVHDYSIEEDGFCPIGSAKRFLASIPT